MTRRAKISLVMVAAIAMAVIAVWSFRSHLSPPDATSQPSPPVAGAAPVASPERPVAQSALEEPPPAPVPAADSAPLVTNPEAVTATRRMYAAHASLREPEVADPDSESNRRTLSIMVRKALDRAAAGSSPAPSETTNTAQP